MYITETGNELYARWSCPADYVRNTWTHVVGVYDATEGNQRLDVYVDGVLENGDLFGGGPIVESQLPTSTTPNNLPVFIGASEGTLSTMDGKIDNVMFFKFLFNIIFEHHSSVPVLDVISRAHHTPCQDLFHVLGQDFEHQCIA